MSENTNQSIFIIQQQEAYDSNAGSDFANGQEVTQDEYNAWANDNSVTALDPNGDTVDIVGGDDKISVTDGTTTVGYDNVVQPGDGFGVTSYNTAVSQPADDTITNDEALAFLQQNVDTAIALRESIVYELDGLGRDPESSVITIDGVKGFTLDAAEAGIDLAYAALYAYKDNLPALVTELQDLALQTISEYQAAVEGGAIVNLPRDLEPFDGQNTSTTVDIIGPPGTTVAGSVADSTATGLSAETRAQLDLALETELTNLALSNPNLATASGRAQAIENANLAGNLLEADGNGLNLTTEERRVLQRVINDGLAVAVTTRDTLNQAQDLIDSVRNISISDSSPLTFTEAKRALINDFYDGLTVEQKSIINNSGIGTTFNTLIGDVNNSGGLGIIGISNLGLVPYTVANDTLGLDATQRITDALIAQYISQNGSITEEQVQAIETLVLTQNAINTQALVANDIATAGIESEINSTLSRNQRVSTDAVTDTTLPTEDQGDTAIQTVEVTANTSVTKAIRDSLGLENQGPVVEKLISKAIDLALNQIPGYSEINRAIGTANKIVRIGDIVTNVSTTPAETALALARLFVPQINLVVTGYNLLADGNNIGGGGGTFASEDVPVTEFSEYRIIDPNTDPNTNIGELVQDYNNIGLTPAEVTQIDDFIAQYRSSDGNIDINAALTGMLKVFSSTITDLSAFVDQLAISLSTFRLTDAYGELTAQEKANLELTLTELVDLAENGDFTNAKATIDAFLANPNIGVSTNQPVNAVTDPQAGGGGEDEDPPPGSIDFGPVAVNTETDPQTGNDNTAADVSASQVATVAVDVGGAYVAVYNPATGNYDVVNEATGTVILAGLTRDQANTAAAAYASGNTSDIELDPPVQNAAAAAVTNAQDPSLYPNGLAYDDDGNLNPGWALDENNNPVYVGGNYVEPATAASAAASFQAAQVQAKKNQANAQATIATQRKQANEGDWRVKLRLAESADYLYRDPSINENGVLWPLTVTNGVVFPYTPTISTNYAANYNTYDLTHSNYRGLFYQNSYVDEVNITASFTAQDTTEANYMLAVIHFFRSVTKMFYGQDANRGQPPPLVFLQGLGEFQFNLHPCVVRTFNYNLPNDVDYIRARSVNVNGTNLLGRRARADTPAGLSWFSNIRLDNAGLQSGGVNPPPAPPTLGIASPTYVPTKLDITIGLLPVQTRSQVSKQFSLKQFANGDLIKGGYW